MCNSYKSPVGTRSEMVPYDGCPEIHSKQVGRIKVVWLWGETAIRRASDPRTAKASSAGLLWNAAAAGQMWGAPPSLGFATSSGQRTGVLWQLLNAYTKRCGATARPSGSLPSRQMGWGAKRSWLGRDGGSCTAKRGGIWRCQHMDDADEDLSTFAGSVSGDRTGLRQTTTEC